MMWILSNRILVIFFKDITDTYNFTFTTSHFTKVDLKRFINFLYREKYPNNSICIIVVYFELLWQLLYDNLIADLIKIDFLVKM